MTFSPLDYFLLGVAVAVTFYVSIVPNPYPKGSEENRTLRMCRVAHVLIWWGLDFGLIGLGLMVAAFVLGLIALVKGRRAYGAVVVIGSVIAPIVNLALTIQSVASLVTN